MDETGRISPTQEADAGPGVTSHEEHEASLDETESRQVDVAIKVDDPPPPYDSDPPPAYSPRDLRRSISRAKQESNGNVDFAKKVFMGFCCGSLCCGITIALHLAIPTSMIAMGSIYLHSCGRQKFIPIYLVVGGCFGCAKAIINIVDQVLKARRLRRREEGEDTPIRRANPADGVVSCFLMAWFIAGCYWIYSIHEDFQSTDPSIPETYCNETLYLYAFWLTTTSFILMGLGLCCCCVLCVAMCVVKKREE